MIGGPNRVSASVTCRFRRSAEPAARAALDPVVALAQARLDLQGPRARSLVDLAPWVQLVNGIFTTPVSERLGNYQFRPYWAPLYDQMRVR